MLTDPQIYVTYQLQKARLEAMRKAEVAYHAATQVEGEQPNRIKAMVKGVVAFVKRVGTQSAEATETNKAALVKMSNE